jgi:transketolase
MYDILQEQELNVLKQQEPQRFQYVPEGGFYLNLKGLELKPVEGIDLTRMQNLARIIRGLAFSAIEGIKSGHPGGSSSKVEQILTLVTSGVLAFDPMKERHPGRDRMVWSAGHCTPLFHATLALIYESLRRQGTEIDKDKLGAVMPGCLARFRHCNGPTGHVESHYALADVSTGSSGHGFSAGLGLAILQKSCGLPCKVFVMAGDAETEEGISYEARNLINTLGADNLIVSLDWNGFGIDGPITDVISTPYLNHWWGLGWNVIEVDGHNVTELNYAYQKATQGFGNNRPTAVVCHTIKGKFYGKYENTPASHGSPAPHPEYVEIMKKLGFDVPGIDGEIQKDIDVVTSQITAEDVGYLIGRLEIAKQKIRPEEELKKAMETALAGRPLADYRNIKRPATLPPELVFKEGEKTPTRKASEAFFKWLMGQSAFFWIGTGDLSGSILTGEAEKVYGILNRSNPLGRGIRFGIAEQNMAMMSTSLTLDILPGGWRPMSVFASYGVFTSIMSNSVRMALINNYFDPVAKGFFILLAAHDGPETAEDGPTHHGMFWMSLFDAYPGIKVYKPMDANETIEMLFYAMERGEPVAFSVMRPPTPVLVRGNGVPPAREAVNGAYVYRPFLNNGKPKKILAVCGGQVMANILEVLPELEQNLDIKIIAVTSPELFEELRERDPQKANAVLSDEERQYVIALHNGWPGFMYRFVLPGDYEKRVIGISEYLKSGPAPEVYQLAGFDAKSLKEKILKAIQ